MLLASLYVRLGIMAWIVSGGPDAPVEWTQFRGPSGDGQGADATHPISWSEDSNIAWKAVVPGTGWSQPIVSRGKVIVTTAISEDGSKPLKMSEGSSDRRSIFGDTKPPETVYRWETHCYDLETGSPVWQQRLAEQPPGVPAHPSNTFATETPATDGKRVFVYFGSIGKLAALNIDDGKLEWEADLGVYPMTAGLGTGSSPVVLDGKVFVQSYNEKNSFLVALDAETGAEVWRASRSNGTSWSTPFFWRTKDRTDLVACGKSRVYGYNPADGSVVWEMGGIVGGFSATPVANADKLVVGNNGPLSPAPLLTVNAGASGDITLPKGEKSSEQIPWSKLRIGPGLASPVLVGDLIYIAADSFLNCYQLQTGERVYKVRLPDATQIVSSPWVAGENLFILDESGRTYAVKTGPAYELVSVNPLSDTFWSSPAVAGDSILLRGVDKLYCVRAR